MAESKMKISVNGESKVPPGFRFHPTEEELLHYYLRKKVSSHSIDLDVITDVDLNKLEPWDIQERCKIGTTPQNDWYFFSHKDKKYPTGTRTNRATAAGFWKATGRDKAIYSHATRIGMRKTLVFYKGRAPHGQKSDWIMHEYRLDDPTDHVCSNVLGDATHGEEGWVVCRIFKKKNHLKTLNNPMTSSETTRTNNEGALDHILHYMGRACKQENDNNNNNNNASNRFLGQIETTVNAGSYQERFIMKLPNLESPNNSTSSQNCHQPINITQLLGDDINSVTGTGLTTNWAALDRLVASQLNGQTESFSAYCTQPDEYPHDLNQLVRSSSRPDFYSSEVDLWSFTRSSSSSVIGEPLSNTRS